MTEKMRIAMSRINRMSAVWLTGFILFAAGCAHIPESPDKPVSYSMEPAKEGMLVEASEAALADAGELESAFLLIPKNDDALRWRLALIDSAQKSIDLQVFIWTNDESGRLMLRRIGAAAERGVKVRLLLDDLPKDWPDKITALVSRSPHIQVRRFNPGRVRKGLIGRTFQMSTQFRQLNRRMHNKQLIVDGRWGIIGGRNIGNPYFGLSTKYNNRDLDLLVTGPIIRELAEDFDEYWNSDAAYPGEAMYKEISGKEKEKIYERFAKTVQADREFLKQTSIPVDPVDWQPQFSGLKTNRVFGAARSLKDSPEVKGDRGIRLEEQITEAAPSVRMISCIITPYLIPTKEQIANIERLVKEEGRRVQLLVPTMESNNHTMVHSHYRKYRKKLLRAGAELYEFRGQPSAGMRTQSDTPPVKSKFISLHTKGFILDDEWVLLGSLNVDPRSIKINTEHMMIVESPELAGQMRADFEWMIDPANSWQVTLDDKGKLRWTSAAGVIKRQPARSTGQRISDFFYRWLPLEGQL
jgi:putative cardiolipin synthase